MLITTIACFLTFLCTLIIDPHVHHRGGVVPHDLPVPSIFFVTCSNLVASLVGPPQLVSCCQGNEVVEYPPSTALFRCWPWENRQLHSSVITLLFLILPMMASAVALESLPLTPSMTSSFVPSSWQWLMVPFPELIQYSCSFS